MQKSVKREDTICYAHKGNVELTVNPFDEMSVRKIKYKADGSIYSEDAFMRELERTYTSLVQERNLTPYCGIIIS